MSIVALDTKQSFQIYELKTKLINSATLCFVHPADLKKKKKSD